MEESSCMFWGHSIHRVLILSMIPLFAPTHHHVLCASLHWLHLCGFHQCPSSDGDDGATIINHWINYKTEWLQQVYDMALKGNATLLLFKTTNFICDEKRTNEWATWSSLYLSFDSQTIDGCYQESLKFAESPHNIPLGKIYEYCNHGQFTERGSEYLNVQIKDFVREKNEERVSAIGDNEPTLTVGIFDDHDVEGCDSTEDSIHHPLKMLMRLRLLSNTIESYSECSLLQRRSTNNE